LCLGHDFRNRFLLADRHNVDARNAFDLAHLLDQLDANLAAFRTLVLGAFPRFSCNVRRPIDPG